MSDQSRAALRMKFLCDLLNEGSIAYYRGEPSMPDSVYDAYYKELVALESLHPDQVLPYSVTHRVGYKPTGELPVVPHKRKMLSIHTSTVYEASYANDWYAATLNEIGREVTGDSFEVSSELKIDGLALSIHYLDGEFQQAVIRGDHEAGEDVSAQARTIRDIPLKLLGPVHGWIEVRGEVFMRKEAFDAVNKQRLEANEKPYANQRSAAAGSLRTLDSRITAKAGLSFFAYTLYADKDLGIESQSESLKALRRLGFVIAPHSIVTSNPKDLVSQYEFIEQNRSLLGFDIDGIVYKVNQFNQQTLLGENNREPKWCVAHKFRPEVAVSEIIDIEIAVGRTGRITPVAKIKPVHVGGVIVKSVLLHTQETINTLGVYIGAKVYVRRSGDTIPNILGLAEVQQQHPYRILDHHKRCPTCQTKLTLYHSDVVCPNEGCSSKLARRVEYIASREVLNIRGLGNRLIHQLVDKCLINNVVDLFRLTPDQLVHFHGVGIARATEIVNEIKQATNVTFAQFIQVLCIPRIADHTSTLLAKKFGTIERLMKATKNEIVNTKGLSDDSAERIIQWVTHPDNIKLVEELSKYLILSEVEVKPLSDKLKDLRIAKTGEISMSSDALKALIESHGGIYAMSVSSKTDYLIVGEKPGENKLDAATEHGVKIIDELEFFTLLK